MDILFDRWISTNASDKLAERHEALAQSVELLLHTQREAFAKHDALSRSTIIQEYERRLRGMKRRWRRIRFCLSQVVESIDSLARIAHAHEQRITGLEDRPQ